MTKDSSSVESNVTVYIGLGANLGDRKANLREALAHIEKLGVEVVRESSIYETEPVGFRNQPWFLNKVTELRIDRATTPGDAAMAAIIRSTPQRQEPDYASSLRLLAFHRALQRIEHEMGRERTIQDGPRVIDIDLLLCGDTIASWAETHGSDKARAGSSFLTIPHPRMHLRRFVLEPLCEIAPTLIHPVLNKTCSEILASLDDHSIVRIYRSAADSS